MNQPPAGSRTLENGYRNIFESACEAFIIYDLETGLVVDANLAACEMHGYSCRNFLILEPVTFMQPESYLIFKEHLRTARVGEIMESLLIHLHKDRGPFYVEVRRSLIQYQGRPCLLGAIRNVSKRIQIEKTLSEQIEARRREQATLLSISHILASTLELQPGLILEQLKEIIPYTYGALFALQDEALVSLAMSGSQQLEADTPLRIPVNNPETLTVLFNEHRPMRIADINSDDAQMMRLILGDRASALLEGMQGCMWVPLAVRGRIIGGIWLAESTQDYFTPYHANLVLSVANQAAITMINTELYGQARALAVLEERQNLARSLHDAVNQSLFSAGLIAEVLPRLWERDQAEARHSLEDLRRLTRGAQAEMRTLLAELRPTTLTDSDLGDLLHLLGNAISGRINIPVTVNVSGEFNLPAEIQIAFYRICQEALNNVAKHAKATQLDIYLAQVAGVIELRIRDDGQGFDLTQNFSGHYGLSMMRERAQAAGASLSVTSQPGFGTELIMSWIQPILKDAL